MKKILSLLSSACLVAVAPSFSFVSCFAPSKYSYITEADKKMLDAYKTNEITEKIGDILFNTLAQAGDDTYYYTFIKVIENVNYIFSNSEQKLVNKVIESVFNESAYIELRYIIDRLNDEKVKLGRSERLIIVINAYNSVSKGYKTINQLNFYIDLFDKWEVASNNVGSITK